MPSRIPSRTVFFCTISKTTKEKRSVLPLNLWNLVLSVWKDDFKRRRRSTFVSIPKPTICINDLFLSCINACSPEWTHCVLWAIRGRKDQGLEKKKANGWSWESVYDAELHPQGLNLEVVLHKAVQLQTSLLLFIACLWSEDWRRSLILNWCHALCKNTPKALSRLVNLWCVCFSKDGAEMWEGWEGSGFELMQSLSRREVLLE